MANNETKFEVTNFIVTVDGQEIQEKYGSFINNLTAWDKIRPYLINSQSRGSPG